MRTSAYCSAFRSGVTSPVSSRTDFFSEPTSNLFFQSMILSFANAFKGAMKIILLLGVFLNTRSIANSDMIVFPDPVGAPIRAFESVWNKVWKTCVCTGLKNLNFSIYSSSNFSSPSYFMESGRKGSSLVLGKSSPGTSNSLKSMF